MFNQKELDLIRTLVNIALSETYFKLGPDVFVASSTILRKLNYFDRIEKQNYSKDLPELPF